MNAAAIAGLCVAAVTFGVIWRITQAVLWILNGHRSSTLHD